VSLGFGLDPILQAVLKSVNKVEIWEVVNCAEVSVVNKWVTAATDDTAKKAMLGKIKVKSFYGSGKEKPLCKNCSQWLSKPGKDYITFGAS
jgi:hypothetical protein